MKKIYLAALALGLTTTVALAQADRLAIQSEPAKGGNIAWHLGPSFPDSGGFTLVDCSVSPGFSWKGFELMQSGSDVAHRLREAGGKVA